MEWSAVYLQARSADKAIHWNPQNFHHLILPSDLTETFEHINHQFIFYIDLNRRTLEGMQLRDAYKSVGIEVNEGKFRN